ncbi:MAG: 50S ribosomal protein L21, partial [bacterium]
LLKEEAFPAPSKDGGGAIRRAAKIPGKPKGAEGPRRRDFMYAVLETGGKQVRVEPGDSVKVERLSGEVGDSVELDDVRLIVDGDKVVADQGTLEASSVKAVIRGHGRGDKVYAFRFKRRKNVRVKRGHRQYYTEIEVTEILTGGK